MSSILIIGASSDIGFAIAAQFASKEFDVMLAGRNLAQLETLRSDLAIRFRISSTTHRFDALNFEEHESFLASLPNLPSITVYVSGYMTDNDQAYANWDESLRTIQTNYTGAISILNKVASRYEKEGQGTIVGISSVAGNRGRQSNFIYGSSKAAFTSYLSGLRNRLYKKNVHVLTVLPGFVYTRMTEDLKLPALLTAKPDDVGRAVYNAVIKKRNVIYVKWFWRFIMLVIVLIPETIFKKLKL